MEEFAIYRRHQKKDTLASVQAGQENFAKSILVMRLSTPVLTEASAFRHLRQLATDVTVLDFSKSQESTVKSHHATRQIKENTSVSMASALLRMVFQTAFVETDFTASTASLHRAQTIIVRMVVNVLFKNKIQLTKVKVLESQKF